MIGDATLLTFTLAALMLLLTPGPAMIFVLARSIEAGRMADVNS